MKEFIEISILISFLIVIFDYFKEVNKKIFYFSCWICILACLFDPQTRGFTNISNLIFAFLIFMAFRQRKNRENKIQIIL